MDIAGVVAVKVQADLLPLDKGFEEAHRKSEKFDRSASKSFRGAGRSAKEFGNDATGAARRAAAANDNLSASTVAVSRAYNLAKTQIIALGAATVAAFSVQPIFAFRDAMGEVSTLVDTATFDMAALESAALRQASAFGGGAAGQAKAYYQIISAGASSAAQATETLTSANKLAVGGVTDVRTAADGLTSVLNAYGDKVESAAAVSDALFVGMRAGKTTIGELSATLGKVAPLAAQTGVSFDELVASVSALTKGGIATTEAVTGVRAILAAVAKPTKEASDLSQSLGLQFNSTALASKGLAGFLQDIVDRTGGSTDALAQLFGGVEALIPIMALSGQAGADFTAILQSMAEKAGQTEEAFNKMANTPGFQAGRLWSALQAEVLGVGGSMSNVLVPAMKLIADNMGLIVTSMMIFTAGHLASAIGSVVVQVAALTAGMNLATIAARALSVAMALIGGPVGIAVTFLAGAYLLLRDNVSAAEQATRDAKSAYDVNEKALNDNKAASEGYTLALRNQIAMQVETARSSATLAEAEWQSALKRRDAFRAATGLNFAPLEYASEVASAQATALDLALFKLEDQLAKVDKNLKDTTTTTTTTTTGLGELSKSAQKAADSYRKIVQGAQQFIAAQELERGAIRLTEEAANRLRYEQDLLNKAANDNLKLTPAQTDNLKALAASMASAEAETSALKEAFDFAKDTTRGFFSDFSSGIAEGKSLWESFSNAAVNALNKITDKLLNEVLDAIFQVNSAGTGGGGGIFGFLGGLLGGGGGLSSGAMSAVAGGAGGLYANGGAFSGGNVIPFARGGVVSGPTIFPMANGAGLMGEAGPEAVMPLRRLPNGKLGVEASGGGAANGNQPMNINVNVSGARGNTEIREMVSAGVKQGLSQYDRSVLPARVNQIAKDPRAR